MNHEVGQHPVEQAIGIEDRNLDVEDVRQRLHQFAALALLAAIEELLAGLRRFILRQAGRQELLGETLQIFEREPFGPKALLVFLLRIVERVLAVHQADQEVLLLLEAVVAQADRVLDDVVGAAFVLLRLDLQIVPDPNPNLFAAFYVGCAWRQRHESSRA